MYQHSDVSLKPLDGLPILGLTRLTGCESPAAMLITIGASQEPWMLPKETRTQPKVTQSEIGIRPTNPQLISPAKFEVNWINNISENASNCTATARPITGDQKCIRTGQSLNTPGNTFAHTDIQKQKALTHHCFLREFEEIVIPVMYSCVDLTYRYVRNVLLLAYRHMYIRLYTYETTLRASRVFRTCKLELFRRNGRTSKFWPHVYSVFWKYVRRTVRCLVLIESLYKVIPNFHYCNCHPRQFASQQQHLTRTNPVGPHIAFCATFSDRGISI